MGVCVFVYGKSGAGKSRSMKTFGSEEVFLVNVEGKQLPFRNQFKYVWKGDNVDQIKQALQKMPTKTAVIDDAGYLMTHHFMKFHRNKKGNSSFEMYDDIADMMFGLVTFVKNALPDDVVVYMMFHEDKDENGEAGILTLGKLLDRKVNLVGMVTICLHCMSEDGKHFFRVRTDGSDVAKSPEDMFSDNEIENDLKAVDTAIREYWGLNKEVSK